MRELLQLWGRNIATARVAAGYKTQEAFAARLNVKQQTVSRWESGGAPPRDRMKLAIAEATGQDVNDIFPLSLQVLA